MNLEAGRVIAGRYRLEHRIGAGGMGEVWAAEHVSIGVRVALKTLLAAAAVDQQIVARFRREAYLLGRLRSDRVARVVDFLDEPELGLVLVMDYVEGEALAGTLEARELQVEEAIDLGVDIASALCDLHRAKVVHRDLKPDNIILEPGPDGKRRAVIVDFGVSRLETGRGGEEEEITNITQADVAVGTIPYMAPEQFLSSRDVTSAADVYAVGAILFRAVAGRHVYGADQDLDYAKLKLTTRAPELPLRRFDRVGRGFAAVVARALERVPDARFESAETLLAELRELQALARATALDLEATTEQALPPSTIVDEPTDAEEATRLMSRPPQASAPDLLAESTQESPLAASLLPDAPRGSISVISRPTVSRPAPTARTTTVPETAPSGSGGRPTILSPGVERKAPAPEPAPPSVPSTPSSRAPSSQEIPVWPPPPVVRTFTLQALVVAVVAALLAGGALGFAIARAL